MRIHVALRPGNDEKVVELAPGASGLDLIRSLDLAPDAHVLLRGEAPIPEDEALRDGDRIRVVAVVSGG